MDNMSSHKSDNLKAFYKELDITPLYNVPHFPDGNPAEGCFSVVKNYYKRMRLCHLVNDAYFEPTRHI